MLRGGAGRDYSVKAREEAVSGREVLRHEE